MSSMALLPIHTKQVTINGLSVPPFDSAARVTGMLYAKPERGNVTTAEIEKVL
jgi:hypothetical protein